MKAHLPFLLTAGLIFAGCSKQEDKPAAAAPAAASTNATGNPLTAPADYLGAVGRAKTVAEKTVDTVSINQAIQLFNAQEGRLPKDLQELVTQKYLPRIPEPPYGMKFEYDAKSGQVKVVKGQ